MSFFKKPKLSEAFIDLLGSVITFTDSDTRPVSYIKTTFSKPSDQEQPPSIYECQSDDEDDFEGDYLGEVELKLEETSLVDCENIHYKDEKDLLNIVASFIYQKTSNYLPIKKDDWLELVIDKGSVFLYDKYKRGNINTLFCSKKFEEEHATPGQPKEAREENVINVECLPPGVAIGVYKSNIDREVVVLAHLNQRKKTIRLKLVSDLVVALTEV